jgi:hypothetical protein
MSFPPSHARPWGKGASSGPGETSGAARTAAPLLRRAIMRDRLFSVKCSELASYAKTCFGLTKSCPFLPLGSAFEDVVPVLSFDERPKADEENAESFR